MASFRKRNDVWEYRIRYKIGNIHKEKSKSGFKTKKEAQLATASVEAKLSKNIDISQADILFREFILDWMEVYKKPHVKYSTYLSIERTVRLHLIPMFGDCKLKEITKIMYQKWINENSKKFKIGTIKLWHSIMRNAMDTALHDLNMIDINPTERVRFPQTAEKNKIQYLEFDQMERLLKHMESHPNFRRPYPIQYITLFTLLARTGLRIGEALALTWSDIDFSASKLSVTKTLFYNDSSTPIIQSPKSNRTIMVDSKTISLLKKHQINQKEVSMRRVDLNRPKKNLVFLNESGTYLHPVCAREYLKSKCKQVNVPRVSLHAFRHSHAVHLLESGANLKYVSERLGHSSIQMTADIYLHVSKKIEDDTIQTYEKYINSK